MPSTVLTEALKEFPLELALFEAIQASITAHKGETSLDTGLDVLSDVLPNVKALVKAYEADLAPKQ